MKATLNAIIAAIILAATAVGTRAETHYKPHIAIGARAGMSMSQVSFSPSVKQLWNNGTAGAVTFRYSEEKIFGVIAELGWQTRGWKENFEDTPFSYSHSLTYLRLPLLTHIYFGAPRFKAFINLGPEFSYMVADKISADFDYRNPASVPDFPIANRMTEQMATPIKNKFDYGIAGGAGFEFYISPRNSIVVEGRYYFGLGNIFPAAKADTFSASRNSSIEISLGYNFRLK